IARHEHHVRKPLGEPAEDAADLVGRAQRHDVAGEHQHVAGDGHLARERLAAVAIELEVQIGEHLDAHGSVPATRRRGATSWASRSSPRPARLNSTWGNARSTSQTTMLTVPAIRNGGSTGR